jgi:hypothetical protein
MGESCVGFSLHCPSSIAACFSVALICVSRRTSRSPAVHGCVVPHSFRHLPPKLCVPPETSPVNPQPDNVRSSSRFRIVSSENPRLLLSDGQCIAGASILPPGKARSSGAVWAAWYANPDRASFVDHTVGSRGVCRHAEFSHQSRDRWRIASYDCAVSMTRASRGRPCRTWRRR